MIQVSSKEFLRWKTFRAENGNGTLQQIRSTGEVKVTISKRNQGKMFIAGLTTWKFDLRGSEKIQ